MSHPIRREHTPAHLLHVFPSFGAGGVPIRMCEMMNRLGPRYRHTVIALDGVAAARARLEKTTVAEFPSLRFEKRRPFATLLAFAGVLRRIRPDLLLTYNWGAVEWGFLNRLLRVCPHIHFESGFGPEEADGQIRRRVLLRRLALARAAAVVMPSQKLVHLATDVWRLPPDRLRFIPNGVDAARFAAAPEPGIVPGFRKAAGELVVGTVAPLRAEKNIGRLIRAFAAVPERLGARLLIVGDGPERTRLEATAAVLGVTARTVFAGHVEAPEKVFGWFDVFAISSDTEQMPNALLQAMAASRAVAGVDVGDVGTIVAAENRRFIVARDDEKGLAATITALLEDEELRRALGVANYARAANVYGIDRMVEQYRELFESALAMGAAPAGSDLALAR